MITQESVDLMQRGDRAKLVAERLLEETTEIISHAKRLSRKATKLFGEARSVAGRRTTTPESRTMGETEPGAHDGDNPANGASSTESNGTDECSSV
jgi:hypothetical protein